MTFRLFPFNWHTSISQVTSFLPSSSLPSLLPLTYTHLSPVAPSHLISRLSWRFLPPPLRALHSVHLSAVTFLFPLLSSVLPWSIVRYSPLPPLTLRPSRPCLSFSILQLIFSSARKPSPLTTSTRSRQFHEFLMQFHSPGWKQEQRRAVLVSRERCVWENSPLPLPKYFRYN